ncbi:hypothetical protein DFH27DRAFT_560969 [Peziza echinospora]|nr:hypothetical protein DFH27DRAFT_560969 [Peziza echinospora]
MSTHLKCEVLHWMLACLLLYVCMIKVLESNTMHLLTCRGNLHRVGKAHLSCSRSLTGRTRCSPRLWVYAIRPKDAKRGEAVQEG